MAHILPHPSAILCGCKGAEYANQRPNSAAALRMIPPMNNSLAGLFATALYVHLCVISYCCCVRSDMFIAATPASVCLRLQLATGLSATKQEKYPTTLTGALLPKLLQFTMFQTSLRSVLCAAAVRAGVLCRCAGVCLGLSEQQISYEYSAAAVIAI